MDDIIEHELELEQEEELKNKYLTFLMSTEVYALEIRFVTEIIGIQKVTLVPDTPEFIKGVINLRGKVIPIMDVRLRFGMPEQDYNERTCVVVVDVEDVTMGLVVDTVSDVATIEEEQIDRSMSKKSSGSSAIMGMGKCGDEVRILLDAKELIHSKDLDFAKDLAGEET